MHEVDMYNRSSCSETDVLASIHSTAEKSFSHILNALDELNLSRSANVIIAGIVSPNFATVSNDFVIDIQTFVSKSHISTLSVGIHQTLCPFIFLAPIDGNVGKFYEELQTFATGEVRSNKSRKMVEMVIFGRKKSFLDFYLVYNHVCIKIFRPIQ